MGTTLAGLDGGPKREPPDKIFVNGQLVAKHGSFPPHPLWAVRTETFVFDLQAKLISPGRTAVIARRLWVPSYVGRVRG